MNYYYFGLSITIIVCTLFIGLLCCVIVFQHDIIDVSKQEYSFLMMSQFDSEINHRDARWVMLCPTCLDKVCSMLGYPTPYTWQEAALDGEL